MGRWLYDWQHPEMQATPKKTPAKPKSATKAVKPKTSVKKVCVDARVALGHQSGAGHAQEDPCQEDSCHQGW